MTNTQDEFASSSGYSRDKFYTTSTDGGNGGSRKLQVWFPTSLVGELGALVARQVFPDYRTSHDIVRSAVVHQIRYDMERVKDPAIMTRLQALNSHLLAINALDDIKRRQQASENLQQLAYTVQPQMLVGQQRQIADADLVAAIELLADNPNLVNILRSKQ